jgi:hypothetical protein
LVRLVEDRYRPGPWSEPILLCALCRESHEGCWQVAPGWHDGIEIPVEPRMDPEAWAKWVANNPSLTDEQLAELDDSSLS